MNADELKQFKELAKKYEPKDKDDVLKVLQDDVHEVFQEINDGGRTAANKDNGSKLEKVEKDLKAEKEAREKAEKDLKELNGKAPDAAALKQQYDREIQEIRETARKEVESAQGETVAERLETAKEKLRVKLSQKDLDITPEYANTIMMNDPNIIGRLKPGPDKQVGVLKKGTTDVFLVPPKDGDVFDVFAKELAAAVPTDWKASKVRRGSGLTGSAGGGGTSGGIFQQVRAEEKQRSETKKSEKRSTGLDRLGRKR